MRFSPSIYAERLQLAVYPFLAHFRLHAVCIFLFLGWVHGRIDVATTIAAAIWWDQRAELLCAVRVLELPATRLSKNTF